MSQSTKYWHLTVGPGKAEDFADFELQEKPIPEVGDNEVLINVKALSLNFRDLAIYKNQYPLPLAPAMVPCSDGAGIITAVGSKVTRFEKGDKVMPIFTQDHLYGYHRPTYFGSSLGGGLDGLASQYMAISEQGLVKVPKDYDFIQAATLPCAALTAWNALYGLKSRALKAGDWVLTQGTGGVSIFALQFAKAAGARVVSTTSSAEKAERLRKLGADHVINYREDKNWGTTAKNFTRSQEGFDHIVEVGGPGTLKQSFEAIKMEGVISIIGFVGQGGEDMPGLLDILPNNCIVRGILIGSRDQFEDMVKAIEANDLKPVVDEKVFEFEEFKEAYKYMAGQKHFGKVVVKVDQ